MAFRIIEHTADIAIKVDGKSIEELFESACLGWEYITIDNKNKKFEKSKKFLFTSTNYEELIIELLNELNYQLIVKKFVFIKVSKINFTEINSSIQLEVEIFGQKFNADFHTIKEEIKAVTFHQMKIEKVNDLFQTKIVFDI